VVSQTEAAGRLHSQACSVEPPADLRLRLMRKAPAHAPTSAAFLIALHKNDQVTIVSRR